MSDCEGTSDREDRDGDRDCLDIDDAADLPEEAFEETDPDGQQVAQDLIDAGQEDDVLLDPDKRPCTIKNTKLEYEPPADSGTITW